MKIENITRLNGRTALRRPTAEVSTVNVRTDVITLPTYLPAAPDKNPMFLEQRVYQGSSGKVYPLPFTDRIAEKPVDRKWQAIWIENDFLRVLVLPEIGGRIHAILDKTNGYDLIYNQHVIKPALVGLAGPWISGGIEFNWPQHHRPATFLPVNHEIEKHADGSVTVWCRDHDPMSRMKGMHGVCLHPGKAYVELKVRAYNRTPLPQTFLWWANVATRVHEAYQSFFPPDVYYVADHARRSMSEYPLAQGHYYGVNYGERGREGAPESEVPNQFVPPHCATSHAMPHSSGNGNGAPKVQYKANDLSFYANIPVPTSYMCMGSQEDFFGGYDYKAQAGIIHVANHHISPGKKQWTWGNHEFGYAWDRNLTERDAKGEFGPYIEIMAGVYTDNQPDFSFLQPGETKSWSQYWYPIQQIGPAQHANLNAAVSLKISGRKLRLGISVTQNFSDAGILLTGKGQFLYRATRDLVPGQPFVTEVNLAAPCAETDLHLSIVDRTEQEIISYQPKAHAQGEVPPSATEPPAPCDLASADELYVTGQHLDQYRHATRCPTLYWREALRRDPLDARCNNALGLWHYKRGEFVIAEKLFRQAIARLTRRNANPSDGEAHYNLGLCLRQLGRDDEAYAAFYKATWNQAWAAAGYHAVAELDCAKHNWATAVEHLNRSLRFNTDNLRARNLKVIALHKLNHATEADALLRETLALDPLDWWARHLRRDPLQCDLQTRLDLAHDFARGGLFAEAIEILQSATARNSELPDQSWGALPLVHYMLGWLEQRRGDDKAALKIFRCAAALPTDYCFPSRLEEIAVFAAAMRANPGDAQAPYYLGNLLYDKRCHDEAIRLWEKSARLDGGNSVVWRNLGIGNFNIRQQPAKAKAMYARAFIANPADARLLFERDQLWKRLGEKPAKRLRELEKHIALVQQRDDLSVELCALYNQTGQHDKALMLVTTRNFQPWEGGEGGPLGQWVRSHLALGRAAFCSSRGNEAQTTNRQSAIGNRQYNQSLLTSAATHFRAAITAPKNLGEAKHLLANQSDIHYWLGCALAANGDTKQARQHWLATANFKGDFQEMSVRAFSEMTYYSALSWEKLGQPAKAKKLFRDLLAYAEQLRKAEAKIDYFATSLPTMLLFDDDLQARQETTALFLKAQAQLGLGKKALAQRLLATVLRRDPNHALASDLQAQRWRKCNHSNDFANPKARPGRSCGDQLFMYQTCLPNAECGRPGHNNARRGDGLAQFPSLRRERKLLRPGRAHSSALLCLVAAAMLCAPAVMAATLFAPAITNNTAPSYTTPDALLAVTAYANSNATITANLAQQGTWFGVAGGGNASAIDTTESVTLQFAPTAALYSIGFVWTRSKIIISGFAADPGFTDSGGYATGVNYATGTLTFFYNWDSGTEHTFSFSNPSASAGRTLRLNVFDTSSGWQASITRIEYTPTPPPAVADLAAPAQTMDNFSASDSWSMQMVGLWSDANKNTIADLLFSTNNGIGLSAWRFNLAAGFDSTVQASSPGWQPWRTEQGFLVSSNNYDWTRQAGQRWFLSAAKTRGIDQYIAMLYSPPTNFTRNGRVYSTDSTYSSNLKPGYEPAFAQFIGDVLAHFKTNPVVAERVSFNYVMPINEPQWDWNQSSQEGCRYGNTDILTLIPAVSTSLTARGLTTQIIVPEAGDLTALYQQNSFKYGQSYGNYLSSLNSITNLISRNLAAHSYFTDNVTNQLVSIRQTLKTQLAANPFWRYWQTEYCILGTAGPVRDLTMTTALDVSRVIWADVAVANASTWHWWLSLSPADYKDGLLYTDYFTPGDAESLYCSKNFWAFGQWSRFIRPGWKRVDMTTNADVFGLMSAAFVSPTSNSLAMVFINASSVNKLVTPAATGLGAGNGIAYWSPWITSALPSDNLSLLPPLAPGSACVLPTNSVVTLVANIVATNSAPPPIIAGLGNQTATNGQLVLAPVTVISSNVPASFLTVSVSSDNPALLPAGNITVSNVTATATITHEFFSGFSGSGLSKLAAAPAFPNSPFGVAQRALFESPLNTGGNYGSRMRGYVVAPQTGNYTFWIASCGESQLYLSTDGNPVNRRAIAWVTNCAGVRVWNVESNQQSAPVALVAGQRYYIEAVHAAANSAGNLAVGWQLPDTTLERPIPGARLMPWTDPFTNTMQSVLAMQLVTNQTGSANVSVVARDTLGLAATNIFSVTVAQPVNPNPTNLVWQISGSNLLLSWPADHIGWVLQGQTNPLSTGLGTNWTALSGSATSNIWSVPLDLKNAAGFFRLFYTP